MAIGKPRRFRPLRREQLDDARPTRYGKEEWLEHATELAVAGTAVRRAFPRAALLLTTASVGLLCRRRRPEKGWAGPTGRRPRRYPPR